MINRIKINNMNNNRIYQKEHSTHFIDLIFKVYILNISELSQIN